VSEGELGGRFEFREPRNHRLCGALVHLWWVNALWLLLTLAAVFASKEVALFLAFVLRVSLIGVLQLDLRPKFYSNFAHCLYVALGLLVFTLSIRGMGIYIKRKLACIADDLEQLAPGITAGPNRDMAFRILTDSGLVRRLVLEKLGLGSAVGDYRWAPPRERRRRRSRMVPEEKK